MNFVAKGQGMNLKKLSDENLIFETERLARQERELLAMVLHHLHEVNRRRLFSELGYKSLYDFAVRKLGYSEDQAYRRISAMRLLQEVPEVEEKIVSGDLSLAHIGIANSLFRAEAKCSEKTFSKEQKLHVFAQIAGKSVREAERVTLEMASSTATTLEVMKPERTRAVTASHAELKLLVPNETLAKIEKLKGILAHKCPGVTTSELLDRLCDLGLSEWGKTATFRKHRVKASEGLKPKERAEAKCQNCESQYALEVDHIIPRAKGGTDESKNLRVLCRSCNQRAAIKEFGVDQMEFYLMTRS